MTATDWNVCEPVNARLKLRDDLICTPRVFNGKPSYVIEDPLRGKFYRVGLPEFTLISLLDGRTSLADALGKAAQRLGRDALDQQEGISICRWLVDAQLAQTAESSKAGRMRRTADDLAKSKLQARLNPFGFQIPLLNPDRLLERALPYTGWLLGPIFAVAWLAALLAGLYCVMADLPHFVSSSVGVLDPTNWLRMGAAWIVLKAIHESLHALACKKFGGNVRRAGLMFLFFAPVAYVDVTSSWRFRSKWQRIVVAAAGMYIEMFIAALAVIVWSHTGDGTLHRTAYDVAMMAGLSTLIFNANPLMRFDGYYILSDWLEIPNLNSCGQQYLAFRIQRDVLGWEVAQPDWPAVTRRIIACYGLAALAWRGVLYITLTLFLIGWLDAVGVLLAALLAVIWLVMPAYRAVRGLLRARVGQRIQRGRLALLGGSSVVMLVFVALALSRPARIVTPAVVEYSPMCVVRAGSPGFVRQILVQPGQTVAAGEILAVLENADLSLELADLRLALEESQIKARVAFQNDEMNKYQIELGNRDSLRKKLTETEQRVEKLTIRAPTSAQVVARNLPSLAGKYLRAGDELAILGGAAKQVVLAVSQDDVEAFNAHGSQAVEVRIRGNEQGWFVGPGAHVKPRAVVEPPHEALSARAGGPLVVRQKNQASETSRDRKLVYELTQPTFGGTVELPAEQAAALLPGQLADVRFTADDQSVAQRWLKSAQRWVREQIARAQHREA